jgi:hypothetical protein
MKPKVKDNNTKVRLKVNKPATGKVNLKTKGDSANKLVLMQIEEELNKTHFNVNDTNAKIARYAEQVVLITNKIYLGEMEMFSMQRLAHLLNVSRDYLYELAAGDYPNSKLLKKALTNWRLSVADNLMVGGIKKQYSESLSRHWLPLFDSQAMEHETAMAMLKQLETPQQPIQVILNKPSVTGKHKPECGDTEPDGGF